MSVWVNEMVKGWKSARCSVNIDVQYIPVRQNLKGITYANMCVHFTCETPTVQMLNINGQCNEYIYMLCVVVVMVVASKAFFITLRLCLDCSLSHVVTAEKNVNAFTCKRMPRELRIRSAQQYHCFMCKTYVNEDINTRAKRVDVIHCA